MLDSHAGILVRQLTAKLPVSGGPAPIQQAGFSEQKSADTHRADPAHLSRHFPQPRRQRRITHGSSSQSAHQEHGIAKTFDLIEVMTGHECQNTALAFDVKMAGIGDDLSYVNGAARKPVH